MRRTTTQETQVTHPKMEMKLFYHLRVQALFIHMLNEEMVGGNYHI